MPAALTANVAVKFAINVADIFSPRPRHAGTVEVHIGTICVHDSPQSSANLCRIVVRILLRWILGRFLSMTTHLLLIVLPFCR